MSERSALERALARAGETVTLRRRLGTSPAFASIEVLAVVRGYRPDELVGGITQQDSEVILAPLEETSAWPGSAGGSSLPRKGDQIVVGERVHNVEAVGVLRVRGEVVRLQLRIRG